MYIYNDSKGEGTNGERGKGEGEIGRREDAGLLPFFPSPFLPFSYILLIMKIEPGDTVILVLHTPREKLFGLLEEISPAGLFARAIDLSYFDDWCQSIADGEQYLPMSDYFLPMWRLERMMRDDGSPTMAEQFEERTGKKLEDV